jgi:fibronectin type 3 domain-containing protein
MRRSFRSPATSSRAMVVLVSLGAVCVVGQVPQPASAAGTAPPAPAGLNLQANANSSITLTWDPTPGATGYNIYRATSSGGEGSTPIASTARPAYSDMNLSSTPVYFYEVTAVNSAGESPRSAQDASKTPPPAGTGGNAPGVPSGNSLIFYGRDALLGGFDWFQTLKGWYPEALHSSGSISPGHQVIDMAYATQGTMTFNNVVVPARGLYTVDWRYGFASGLFPGVTNRPMGLEVNGQVITTTERFLITGSFNTYQHSTIQVHLNAGKNSITLFAVSGHGVARVDQMTITPATASVPSGPANLTATTGNGSVTLHWTGSISGSPMSYSIYRGSMPDGEATTPIATTGGTTTTFTDTGLKNYRTYFYQVTANDAVGASPGSNEITVTPGVTTLKGTNLALNQPAYASSIQGAGYPASAAVDDNFNTRWSSLFSNPQWLLADLGATHKISQVALYWETAYAKAFQIQVSPDGTNWTTIYATTRGTGGTQILAVNGTGRYIRMYGTQRGTRYGYSLWDFQAFGA